MNRRIAAIVCGVVLTVGSAWAAELKVVQTHKTKDMVVTLKSEAGQWAPGKNSFVLEFTSAGTGEPVAVGKAALSTSMGMPGMAPMVAGGTLTPDKTPGRYLGTISFPDRGERQVSVTWEGPAGKGTAKFSVPVR